MIADPCALVEFNSMETQPEYLFVVNAELAQVGGGTPAVDY